MGNLAAVLPDLLNRIVCPRCKKSLAAVPSADAPVSLRCRGCGNHYAITDGIPILLTERATSPAPADE